MNKMPAPVWERVREVVAVVVVLSFGLGGCALQRSAREAGEGAVATSAGIRRGATLGRWIRVEKEKRRLTLYEDTQPIRSYPIVLGAEPVGAKLYEGDNRTPEGEYRILAKYPHPRWSHFLLLDYPSEMNRLLYEWSKESDLLPRVRGHVPGIGGEVGIHGTIDDGVNRSGEDWTRGCVSLLNRHIEELYDLVDVGTRVVIEK